VTAAYLARIGLSRAELDPLDESALRRITAAHAAAVPFENTRAHRGERISVRTEDVLERIVDRHEGGVCYELNGGLGWLLAELGADVRLVAGQVLVGAASDGAERAGDGDAGQATGGAGGLGGLPMSHMALIVRLPETDREWLADVGFGGDTILRDAPADGDTVTTGRGTSYRIDLRRRELGDFEGLAWWHSTSPGSRFMRGVVVSSTRADGVATLSGRGDGQLAWRFRGERDTAARDVEPDVAQTIAAEVFGLTTPLPRSLVRYAPVTPPGR